MIVGLPIYASAVAVTPIVQAVLAKGAALGTTLSFIFSVFGISIPESPMPRKEMKMKLILMFVGFVAVRCVIVR